MSAIGIVGSEAAKFTPETEKIAKGLIAGLLFWGDFETVVSGGCHLGGIDIWAAEAAEHDGLEIVEHLPRNLSWSGGYAPRNLLIAKDSDEVHCITVKELPATYTSKWRFPVCYHCAKEGPGFADKPHVKSGGCWTMHKARKMGKKGVLHVV